MYKQIIALLALISVALTDALAQIPEIPVESKIESVRVYLEGAQVLRKARVKVPKGKSVLVFGGLSPYADDQSVQVAVDANITLLSVSSRINVLEQKEKQNQVAQLENQKWLLARKKEELKTRKAVYEHEYKLLQENMRVGGVNTGLSTDELVKAAAFHRRGIEEVLNGKMLLESELHQLDSTMDKLQQQLQYLTEKKTEKYKEVLVTVSNKGQLTDAQITLSYYTGNAGWFVDYDLRVYDVESPFELFFKANISQSTGEDWKEVKLTITNSNPSKTADVGTLIPWKLSLEQAKKAASDNYGAVGIGGFDHIEGVVKDNTGEPLIGATVTVPGTAVGAVTDLDGRFSLNIPPSAKTIQVSYVGYNNQILPVNSAWLSVQMEESAALSEVVVVGMGRRSPRLRIRGLSNLRDKKEYIPYNEVVKNPTTIEYEIEAPYTILSDGKVRRIDVVQYEVPAIYSYRSIPKNLEAAFLSAQVPNWQEMNLPTGEVNLFFENAYIGKALLDTDIAADTLEVSLGEDKSVFVDRKLVRELSKKQVVGRNRVVELEFEIFVRNDKSASIDLTVEDQIPLSVDKDIVVDNIEISEGGQLDKETGIITWQVLLNPGESRTFRKKYRVKYPKWTSNLELER